MAPETIDSIKSLNEFIAGKVFFEFSIESYSNNDLLIVGSSDLDYYHEIEVLFKNLSYICCSAGWRVDTSKAVAEILSGAEAKEINIKHRILQGQVLIRLNNEDSLDQWIASESLCVEIRNVPYYTK